ncbi:septin-7 isoform X1 [Pieris napi]|uniref:septin-7 isoform X1 n=1 Tax=Pieris napi TaxID=78633 RepID=UPI001FBAECCD|nr:septin-7 isoform X1 [Pieris napi]
MNGSAATVNGTVNGTNGSLNGIGAAPRTATLGTPSSYAYTSSGSLLGRGGSARPVPPPTLPKYSGSFSAGSVSSAGLRERDREGTGGSHRLASLERLALRQRIIEQSANNQIVTGALNNSTTSTGPTSATVTLTDTATLQSKRELFFKSESVSSGGVSATGLPNTTPPAPPLAPSSLKDALAKRSATLPEPQENNHVEANGTAKLISSASVDIKPNPPQMPAPPVPTSAPPAAPLRSTENIIKKPDHPPVAPKPELPKIEKPKTKELDGYVGFANLPNQVYRKAVKKGFEFTLMVVGETGLGKSTLINSLFLTDVYDKDKHPGPSLRVKKTVGVETSIVLLKENGVNLTLTIVDTPGFGDAVDNSNCWQPIIDFVESKYEEFLNAESRVTRQAAPPDTRVHCCLYFIAPSGHGLKPLDVEFMQRLGDKVNIIPVIAKADTMTPEECMEFKEQIMKEINQHKIKIYDFPESTGEEGEGDATKTLRNRVPFAVVGANTVIEQDGKRIRGRKYPWGIAEVENLEHCDFLALRNMVIRTHLQDLKDVTSSVHYENYRCRKLAGLSHDGKPHRINSNNFCPQGLMNSFMTVWNPLAQMEEEKREHDQKMKKMESEMEQVFESKVREKRAKLKESEAELARRHEATRRALEAQARELEERQRALQAEQSAWERETGLSLDDLRRRSLEANSKETMDGKEKKDKKKKGFNSTYRNVLKKCTL